MEQITRDHPGYDDITRILRSYPALRIPATPDTLRIPDEQAWIDGRELVVTVWRIGPDGDIIWRKRDAGPEEEPNRVRIPID